MQGPDVERLQKMLIYYGHDLGSDGADGWFGPATERALKAYQQSKGQKPTGTIAVSEIESELAWSLNISPGKMGKKPQPSQKQQPLTIEFEKSLKLKNYYGNHTVLTKSKIEEHYSEHLLSPSGRYLACRYYNPYAEGGGYSVGIYFLDLLTGNSQVLYGGALIQQVKEFKDAEVYSTVVDNFYWDENNRLVVTVTGDDEKMTGYHFIIEGK